jgi:hypothetical protein
MLCLEDPQEDGGAVESRPGRRRECGQLQPSSERGATGSGAVGVVNIHQMPMSEWQQLFNLKHAASGFS